MPRDSLAHMPHRPSRACVVTGEFALARGRVHEFCGAARRALALAVAAQLSGPVLWIMPGWQGGSFCGDGVGRWIDPGRLLLVRADREMELLWCMEEALRSGAAPLVVADLETPPGMVPVRRLHLAAGMPEGPAPLGLILTSGTGGAPGIESRWHATPDHASGLTRWQLRRLRARMAPPAAWHLGQPAPRAPLTLHPLAAVEQTA